MAEQAVDPQTKVLLFKMINNGILENINGVISTGKEAVILHAEGGPGIHFKREQISEHISVQNPKLA